MGVTIVASLVFLTPRCGLLALLVFVPLAAFALAVRREVHGRRVLSLPDLPGRGRWPVALALVAVVALLVLAATQPVLLTTSSIRVRADAEAYFVVDTSRSMLAARRPGAPSRLARAKAEAIRLRAELQDIPSGVASFTDRVLPDLFPHPSADVFEQTVRHAVGADEPPPASADVTATWLGALGALGTQNFFAPAARHRLAIVLTDGESRPFDAQATARALSRAPGVDTILIHVGSDRESVFGPGGVPEQRYHPDPASGEALATLAQATGGMALGEDQLGAAARAARKALGSGPTVRVGTTTRTRSIAPLLALASLVPLLFLLGRGRLSLPAAGRRPFARARRERASHRAGQEQPLEGGA